MSSVLRHHQHSIDYTGDGFYRSKDPTNSIKVLKEETDRHIAVFVKFQQGGRLSARPKGTTPETRRAESGGGVLGDPPATGYGGAL